MLVSLSLSQCIFFLLCWKIYIDFFAFKSLRVGVDGRFGLAEPIFFLSDGLSICLIKIKNILKNVQSIFCMLFWGVLKRWSWKSLEVFSYQTLFFSQRISHLDVRLADWKRSLTSLHFLSANFFILMKKKREFQWKNDVH